MDLKSEIEKTTSGGKKELSRVTARCRDDDAVLADLERLASEADAAGDSGTAMRRTTELSALLAGYVIEEMQCRLDRLFLETITHNQPASDGPGSGEEERVSALEEELEYLYPEIGVLAEMSTRKQFGEPIIRELKKRHERSCAASHRKLEYVLLPQPELFDQVGS